VIKRPGPDASFNDRFVYASLRSSAAAVVGMVPLICAFALRELGALSSLHLTWAMVLSALLAVLIGGVVLAIALFNRPAWLVPPSERSARGWTG